MLKLMNLKSVAIILITFLIFFSTSQVAYPQVGGTSTYQFLNLPNSSHVAALGGKVISLYENELSLTYYNPAALNNTMQRQLALNYIDYFTDINYGYVAYSPVFKKLKGNIAFGIHYLNYGKFIEADYTGKITGDFTASDYAANITYSRDIDSFFHVGINLKPIFSFYEKYFSTGIVTDLGITYNNPVNFLTAALVLRNIGFQIVPYSKNGREPVPFEIQLALTKKLTHAPFRFTFLAQQLQKPDMTYSVPETSTNIFVQNQSPSKLKVLGDKIIRHFIVGLDFIPSKSFYISVSYNFQRKLEMQIPSKISSVGLSWGFGLKLTKFQIGFSRCTYHLAGSTNNFSFTLNLGEFNKNL